MSRKLTKASKDDIVWWLTRASKSGSSPLETVTDAMTESVLGIQSIDDFGSLDEIEESLLIMRSAICASAGTPDPDDREAPTDEEIEEAYKTLSDVYSAGTFACIAHFFRCTMGVVDEWHMRMRK